MDTLPVYEITIPLFWHPTNKLHLKGKIDAQHGATIIRKKRNIRDRGERREDGTRRVNLSNICAEYTDGILLPILRH